MANKDSAKKRPAPPTSGGDARQADHGSSKSASKEQQRSQKKSSSSSPDTAKNSHKHRRQNKLGFSLPVHIWLGIGAIVGLGVLKYYSEQSERFGGFHANRNTDAVSHYEVLGVSPSASSSEIRQAYMRKAKENHPDTCPDCADTFQRIASAYQILSDATSRQAYDSADADITLISSEASKISRDNVDDLLGARHPVVIVQVYSDWSYESKAFSQMWERAVEKLGAYMTFARLHETKDAALISRLIPVRTRLIPALAVFIHGKFQRLIPTGIKYTELDANLVSVYPDLVVQLKGEDAVLKFASAPGHNVIAFTQSGKPSMLLKHAALLFDGVVKIGVTSVPAKKVYTALQASEPPNERSLLLSQNSEGKRFWRPIASPTDLLASLRQDIAGQVPVLTSAWQYNALCRSPNIDCVVAVTCKSQSPSKDFVAESRAIRVNHIRATHPLQFAIADFREIRSAFCSSRSDRDTVVVALQDAAQMYVKPVSTPIGDFFASVVDTDKRAELSWENAPTVHARRTSGRWKWNWLLGIALFAGAVLAFGTLWSNTTMIVGITVLMASSIVFQFDWVLPLIRGFFKF